MKTPKQPFSWDEDPNEQPVPMGQSEMGGSSQHGDIAAEAEALVLQSQEAIAREDTEPSIPVVTLADPNGEVVSADLSTDSISRQNSGRVWRFRKTAAAGLAIACCLAFAHGWSYGSRSVVTTPMRPVSGSSL